MKVVVAGASGGIGQPLSLLLKISPLVDDLVLYDVVNSPGVAADLSHVSSGGKVEGFLPKDDGLKKAMTGADLVVIPAGIPRKPGMTRDDLFKINAGIVRDIVEGIATASPKAYILIISNPVNSTVPIAAEVLKKHKVFDPKRLFGVTSLDGVRARTFSAGLKDIKDPETMEIPVVGGHSGETIVPLLSQAKPAVELPKDQLEALVNRIQFGGDEVVKAKDGTGSATLSMAYAGFKFAEVVLKALKGEKTSACAYVYLDKAIEGAEDLKSSVGVDYFAAPISFDTNGAHSITNVLKSANEYEQTLLKAAVEGLKTNIAKGVDFVTGGSK